MRVIEDDIVAALASRGVRGGARAHGVRAGLDDRLDGAGGAREAARLRHRAAAGQRAEDPAPVPAPSCPPVPCPFCGSRQTVLQSEFGSTACKSIHAVCECRQPFEEFKAI